jgi:hypothetical protein
LFVSEESSYSGDHGDFSDPFHSSQDMGLRIFGSECAIGKRDRIPPSPHEVLCGRANEWRASNLHGARRLSPDRMLDGCVRFC